MVTAGDWLLDVGGAYSRDLVPSGNAPAIESDGGTQDHQVGAQLGAHFARGCSVVLASDLDRWDKRQAGGVVVTILTSEGSLVRNLLRPPKRPGQDASQGLSRWLSRSPDRHLTVI